MSLSVKLEAFDGPLDLLLHLIEKNKIDIFDIPIVEITEQYMDYVSKMETKDMDVMSDFLVMAATLLKIKSKMLLPAPPAEEGEEEDPRAELVERLLQYKLYKYASYELKDRQLDASHMIFKKPTIPKEIAEYQEEVDVEALLSDVTFTFRGMLEEQHSKLMLIVTFLGILELMKVGKLKIEQENIFDDILITYVPGVKDVEVVPSSGV